MNKTSKKILITGGGSNIGKDLIFYLLKKNFKVIATFNESKININHQNLKKIKFNFSSTLRLTDKFDIWIHLASLTPTKDKISKLMVKKNTIGLKKVLNSNCNFKKIVLLSTISVYGNIRSNLINEKTKFNKPNYYGKSKIQMENILKEYAKNNYIEYLILRLPGVIGNFTANNTFLNKIIFDLYNHKKVFYKNSENFFNNVVHTLTIFKIIEKFLKTSSFSNQVFNVCSSKPIKLSQIIKFIKKKFNSRSIINVEKDKKSFKICLKKLKKFNLPISKTKVEIMRTIQFYLSKYNRQL